MPPFAVASGNARLATERLSDGPVPAVALHAGVADRRVWVPLAGALDGRVAITAYDRRGFGETPDVVEDHRHVDDLRAVLDHVHPDGAVWLLGSSQGGGIALDFALAHPGRVAGLVLIGTALSGRSPADDVALTDPEQRLSDRIDDADEHGDLDEINRLEAHVWLDGPAAPEGRVTGAPRELFLAMNGRALLAEGAVGEELASAHADPASRLTELGVPTLVLYGDLDLCSVIARNRWIAEQLPHARAVVVPGTAHLPQLEQPEEVAREVAAFVSGPAATAG